MMESKEKIRKEGKKKFLKNLRWQVDSRLVWNESLWDAMRSLASYNAISSEDADRLFEVYNDTRTAQDTLLGIIYSCLLYTSPSPRDRTRSRMPSSA